MFKISENGEDFLVEEKCICGSSKLRFSLPYFAVVCDECCLRTSACDSSKEACIMWDKQMKLLKRKSGGLYMYNSLADYLASKHGKMYLNPWVKEYIDRKTIFWFFRLKRHHYPNVITGSVHSCIIEDYTLKKPNIDWERYGSWMPNTYNSYCKLIRLDLPSCITYRTLDCLFFKRIDALNALNYFWDKRFKGYKIEKEK